MKKLLGYLVLFFTLSGSTFAAENFNLETAKNKLVDENINVAIAYQNYVSINQQAHVRAMQLLPSITTDLLVQDYQYTILRSIIPEPARFFEAAAAKDLAQAANVNRTIVKKNLLQDLETTYFLHQLQKETVVSLKKELEIKTIIAARTNEAYELGAVNFDAFYSAKRAVIAANSNLVNVTEILNTNEFALKLILQVNNLSELDLMFLDFYNATLAYPANVSEAMEVAVNNSKEIEQYDYLIEASRKTKNGVVFSFISWNGVGFDYFARVSVAKSEIKKLQLQKEKTIIETKNQVAAIYAEIGKHKEKMGYQAELLVMAQENYSKALGNYNDQLATLITVKNAEISLMYAERDSRRLAYELELKFIKLKRIIGTNMLTNEIPRA